MCGNNALGENALAHDFRHMALVGKIGDGNAFYIGSNCKIKVTKPGILYLGCNDALNEKNPKMAIVIILALLQ